MPKLFHKHRCIFKPNLNLLIKGDRFKYHAKPRNEVIPNTIAFSKIIKAQFLKFAPRFGLLESVFSRT